MKLVMQVGLGHSHILLDGDPAPHNKKGQNPLICSPYPLWANG